MVTWPLLLFAVCRKRHAKSPYSNIAMSSSNLGQLKISDCQTKLFRDSTAQRWNIVAEAFLSFIVSKNI